MKSLCIAGGGKISGEVCVGGNKNAALPMIAAAMLSDDEVILHNVPDIIDVRHMLEIARCLGATVWREGDRVGIRASTLGHGVLPRELCRAIRTSLLFAGPLAVRFGRAELAPPGGDVIGRRRLDAHFYGLRSLGLEIRSCPDGGYIFSREGKLSGAELFLDEASVTATEHIMMTAVLIPGETVIRNAACEPHVVQLGELLNRMGARISGLETNLLRIEGVERLHGAEIAIAGDHVEAASYLALCAAAGGDIAVTGVANPHDYWMTRQVFERFSASVEVQKECLRLRMVEPARVRADWGNAIPVVSDGPWPQFPSDMMSCLIVVATQASGTVLFFEKMFESRIYFADKLIAMGANIVVCDPHRAVVSGPVRLHGIEMSSPDIRAGMAMVVAACCAQGESLIRNADMIYRGYAGLPEKLRSLGLSVREI